VLCGEEKGGGRGAGSRAPHGGEGGGGLAVGGRHTAGNGSGAAEMVGCGRRSAGAGEEGGGSGWSVGPCGSEREREEKNWGACPGCFGPVRGRWRMGPTQEAQCRFIFIQKFYPRN
jgi:hypothetical protein